MRHVVIVEIQTLCARQIASQDPGKSELISHQIEKCGFGYPRKYGLSIGEESLCRKRMINVQHLCCALVSGAQHMPTNTRLDKRLHVSDFDEIQKVEPNRPTLANRTRCMHDRR